MVISVSDIGVNTSQVRNIRNLRVQLSDLQRQIATQKKSDTFSGLKTDALQIQRLRADTKETNIFLGNINVASARIKIMDTSMNRAMDAAREVLNGLQDIVKGGEVDVTALKTLARESLNFIKDLFNTQHEGRYLFAGSDVTNAPIADLAGMQSNVQAELSDWLDGTSDVTTFLGNITALEGSDLGYSSSISGAGSVTVRADKSLEVNYTVRADSDGFENILRAVSVVANIDFPDPMTDVATTNEFHDLVGGLLSMFESGLSDMEAQSFSLNRGLAIINKVEENHRQDLITVGGLIARIEDVDVAEAITKLQTVETQLTASYETASLMSQLSLVNYI